MPVYTDKDPGAVFLGTEHGVGFFSGMWRNFTILDNISFVALDSTHHGSMEPYYSFPAAGFHLLALNVQDSTWTNCEFELDACHVRIIRDQLGRIVRYEWANNELNQLSTVPDFDHVHHRPYRHLYYNRNLAIRCAIPENVEVKLFFGTDFISVWEGNDPDNPLIYGIGDNNYGQSWNGWGDYFMTGGQGNGVWCVSLPISINGPIVEPGDPIIRNAKYILPNGSNGSNWLPSPDGLIGLVFTTKSDAGVNLATCIRYEVFEISSWQGQCMNYPIQNPQGWEATGDASNFDFSIINENGEYTIDTIDVDTYENGALQYSDRRFSVVKNRNDPGGDTLWLKAKDYAAHAIVLARTGNYVNGRLKDYVSPYGDTLWAVTVPRDYDGRKGVGINHGDFMADAWEESVLTTTNYSKILSFTPFMAVESSGLFSKKQIADFDQLPVGRNFRGDNLTNWEEYRGFMVNGDKNGYFADSFRRTNPIWKDFFFRFIPFVNDTILSYRPGYISALDSLNIFSTESMSALDWINNPGDRFNGDNRSFNIYQKGACFNYYSENGFTNQPLTQAANVVTLWPLDDIEALDGNPYHLNIGTDLGAAVPINWPNWFFGLDTFLVPNQTSRIVINQTLIGDYKNRDSSYYMGQGEPDWAVDFPRMIRWTIAHEIGHSTGMSHIPDSSSTIMREHSPIDTINFRFFYPPINWNNYFDLINLQQISIQEEQQ